MSYLCPVCGYNKLEYPPDNYNICPCCGTEFENDDFDTTHEVLRQDWINKGCRWWSNYDRRPDDWNPEEQLAVFK